MSDCHHYIINSSEMLQNSGQMDAAMSRFRYFNYSIIAGKKTAATKI